MSHGLLRAFRMNRGPCTARDDTEIRLRDPLEYPCRQSRPTAAKGHLLVLPRREVAGLYLNRSLEEKGRAKSTVDAVPGQKKRSPLRVEPSSALDFRETIVVPRSGARRAERLASALIE